MPSPLVTIMAGSPSVIFFSSLLEFCPWLYLLFISPDGSAYCGFCFLLSLSIPHWVYSGIHWTGELFAIFILFFPPFANSIINCLSVGAGFISTSTSHLAPSMVPWLSLEVHTVIAGRVVESSAGFSSCSLPELSLSVFPKHWTASHSEPLFFFFIWNIYLKTKESPGLYQIVLFNR